LNIEKLSTNNALFTQKQSYNQVDPKRNTKPVLIEKKKITGEDIETK